MSLAAEKYTQDGGNWSIYKSQSLSNMLQTKTELEVISVFHSAEFSFLPNMREDSSVLSVPMCSKEHVVNQSIDRLTIKNTFLSWICLKDSTKIGHEAYFPNDAAGSS